MILRAFIVIWSSLLRNEIILIMSLVVSVVIKCGSRGSMKFSGQSRQVCVKRCSQLQLRCCGDDNTLRCYCDATATKHVNQPVTL